MSLLRSPHTSRQEIEALAESRDVLRSRRLLVLLVCHPYCPRQFAFDALIGLGWRDQATVAKAPPAAAPIRRQAERKLLERLPRLTAGERRALARLAPRSVIAAMTMDSDPHCIEALLDNPGVTEADALRILVRNTIPACILVPLRHPRWGAAPSIRAAALRSERVPRGVVLGLLATLSSAQLSSLVTDRSVPAPVRAAATELARGRAETRGRPGAAGTCTNARRL